MLFKFGKFWKTIIFLILSWVAYGFFGFEFTAITILTLIFSQNLSDDYRFL